jgi:hypothetical protein
MNFGGQTRVVNDTANVPVSIGIGNIVECDIHDVHFHMIRRAVASETLLVVPKDIRMTAKLTALMRLLRDINIDQYDELLQRFFEVLPPPGLEEGQYRPSREMIRQALLEASRLEVAVALKLQSRVVIREQGDAITREGIPPFTKTDEQKTVATPPSAAQQPKVVEPKKPKRSTAKSKAKKKAEPVPKTKVKRERL